MEKLTNRAILVYSFMFAYVISFVFNGQVFHCASDEVNYTIENFNLIIMFAHFIGLIIATVFFKTSQQSRGAIKSSILFCAVITPLYLIDNIYVGAASMILVGISSGITVACWGDLYKYAISPKYRMKSIAKALILANLLMIAASLAAYYISCYVSIAIIIAYLVIAFVVAMVTNWNDNIKEKEPVKMKIGRPVFYLVVFVFIITIVSGFMYSIVNPAFSNISYLTSWFWAVPYIIAIMVMGALSKGKSKTIYLYVAIAMIGIGFVLFMLLNSSVFTYIVVDIFLLFAAGLLDLFWVSVIGECLSFYKNPVRLFGIGLAANELGVMVGGLISGYIIAMEIDKSKIVIIVLIIECISLMILPYLVVQLRSVLKNNVNINQYEKMNSEYKKNIINEKSNEKLTAREEEVLQLILKGKTNDDISLELSISKNTVKTHVRNILAKYEVVNRTELISLILSDFL